MLTSLKEIRIKSSSWCKAAVYAVGLLLVYYSALTQMVLHDWSREDYSHCMLIPFVVLYLVWERRSVLGQITSAPSRGGFVIFGLGIALYWLGELGGEFFTLYLSFWCAIVGLLCVHLGWRKIKSIWFALVIMLTMFPFPNFINTRITFQLRLISSKLGVWMLHLYGMSAYREGNVIDLGFTQLQVVDACSGLRYVMPLMVLGLLLAYWFKAQWWKRIILFLSSIPLAIIVNAFRIAATGVLYSAFGARVAEGFFHGFSGWLIFMFAIPCLLAEIWVLRRIPPKNKEERETRNGKVEKEEKHESGNTKHEMGIGSKQASLNLVPRSTFHDSSFAMFVAAVAILALTFILAHSIDFRQKIPISKPFSQFPMQIGEWKGVREDMEQKFLDELKFSDYIMVNYVNPEGKIVNFYVAYYQDQRKGESIHSPETCLPAGGWVFKEAGSAKIPFERNKQPTMVVNRAYIEKGSERELVYYWFPMRGRALTKLYQMKLYTFWDSLTRRRTDGALVRVISPVGPKENPADADSRLREFVQKVVPLLDEYIPK